MAERDETYRGTGKDTRRSRISPRLATILAARAKPDEGSYEPVVLTPRQMDVLRAVVALVVPHAIDGLDIARRIDTTLAQGSGDGWRTEVLPDDAQAYSQGLDTLDAAAGTDGAASFAALPRDRQHALLALLSDGTFVVPRGAGLNARQMCDWFDDLRSDAVRHYVAHPATMAEIDYEGHANGAASGMAFEGWSDRMIKDVR